MILIKVFQKLQIDPQCFRAIEGRGATEDRQDEFFELDFVAQFSIGKVGISGKSDALNANFSALCNAEVHINLIIIHLRDFWANMGEVVPLLPVVILQPWSRIIEQIAVKRRALFEQNALLDFLGSNRRLP